MDYWPAGYLTLLLLVAAFAYGITPRQYKLKGWLGGVMIIVGLIWIIVGIIPWLMF